MNFISDKYLKWWMQDIICNLLTWTTIPMTETSSGSLMKVTLESASTLLLGQNTTKYFAYTVLMELTHINNQQSNNDETKTTWCVKCEIYNLRKYPMYRNVLLTPAPIKHKNTVDSCHILFVWTWITCYCKSPASFRRKWQHVIQHPAACHW